MPITYGTVATISGSGTSHTASITVSGNTPMLVACFRGGGSEGDLVSSVDYNGDALTFVGKVTEPGDLTVVQMWFILNPDPGANTLTITLSGSGFIGGQVALYNGVEQRSQADNATTKTQVDNASVTTSLTPNKNACWTILSCSDRGLTVTAGTGSTKRGNNLFDSNGPIIPAASYSMTVGGGDGGTDWGVVMASFSPDISAGLFLGF